MIAPGQADQTLLHRARLGPHRAAPDQGDDRDVVTPTLRVAEGAGFNAYQLRTSTTPGFTPVVKSIKKLDTTYPLALTQMHNSMEGRGLVREAPLDLYHQDPAFVQKIGIDKDVPQGDCSRATRISSRATKIRRSIRRSLAGEIIPTATSPTVRRGAWSLT